MEQEKLRGKEGDSLIPDQEWEDNLVFFFFVLNHCTLDFYILTGKDNAPHRHQDQTIVFLPTLFLMSNEALFNKKQQFIFETVSAPDECPATPCKPWLNHTFLFLSML